MHIYFKILTWAVLLTSASSFVLPGNGRIFGGEPATEGEFPYHVIFWTNATESNSAFISCNGALVSVDGFQFVLTTALCAGGFQFMPSEIYAGITHRNNTKGHEQRRDVKSIISHEGFYIGTFIHDIAIVLLDTPFEINEFVAPIPLPKQGQSTTGDVIAVGFGLTNFSYPYESEVLNKVQLPVISDEECQDIYGSRNRVSPFMMCTGAVKGKDSCSGDESGPLKAVDGGYLAGMQSWGFAECGDGKFPNVNTEVAFYIDWIQFQLDHNIPETMKN